MNGKESLLWEMEMMRQLEHPKILSLMEVYESDKSVYLVSEYMRGGELL